MSEEQEQEEVKELVKFQAELDLLIKCQESKFRKSCFGCINMFTCDIRSKYVDAVYKSMNPNINDDKAGFEF